MKDEEEEAMLPAKHGKGWHWERKAESLITCQANTTAPKATLCYSSYPCKVWDGLGSSLCKAGDQRGVSELASA